MINYTMSKSVYGGKKRVSAKDEVIIPLLV